MTIVAVNALIPASDPNSFSAIFMSQYCSHLKKAKKQPALDGNLS